MENDETTQVSEPDTAKALFEQKTCDKNSGNYY